MGTLDRVYPWGWKGRRKRGAVMAFSLILVVIAGFVTLRWLSYVNESQRMAGHDRARMQAFYAAEAGIEQVIDYLNNPERYAFDNPEAYTEDYATSPYTPYTGAPTLFDLFEPFVVTIQTDSNGDPVLDADGEVQVEQSTFFHDMSDGMTSKIPTCSLEIADELTFNDLNDKELAHVESIILMHPADFATYGEAEVDADDFVITKVISTATTPQDVTVTVECLLALNPLATIGSPGAIVSESTVEYNGQFNVHWGEVWAKADIELPSSWNNNGQGHILKESEDEWFNLRTVGDLLNHNGTQFADGRETDGYSGTQLTEADGDLYYQPFLEDFLGINGGNGGGNPGSFADYENLFQNQTLEFPTYDYTKIKEHFLSYGLPYYYAAPDGEIYGIDKDESSDTYNQVIKQSFEEWFDSHPTDSDYWDADQFYVFIDSMAVNDSGQVDTESNGELYDSEYYPRAPSEGGVMGTIKEAGQSLHTRGLFFVVNNMEFTGQGNPVDHEDITYDNEPYVKSPLREQGGHELPDNNTTISHNGLYYSWGTMLFSGNRTVYGSLYARNGYLGNGKPEVWYNYRLKDGLWYDNKSAVVRTAWNMRKDDLPDLGS